MLYRAIETKPNTLSQKTIPSPDSTQPTNETTSTKNAGKTAANQKHHTKHQMWPHDQNRNWSSLIKAEQCSRKMMVRATSSQISELKSRIAELESDVEVLQEQIQEFLKSPTVKTFHNGKYTDEIWAIYYVWGRGWESKKCCMTVIEKLALVRMWVTPQSHQVYVPSSRKIAWWVGVRKLYPAWRWYLKAWLPSCHLWCDTLDNGMSWWLGWGTCGDAGHVGHAEDMRGMWWCWITIGITERSFRWHYKLCRRWQCW